jgi:cyclic-di-GMP-binding protein
MATDSSFDIVSELDLQGMDDAVNTSMREVKNRFDLKSLDATIELDRAAKTIVIKAPSEFVVKQLKDILSQKMAKREISPKALKLKKTEPASGGTVRETDEIVSGIDMETAKTMVKDIKAMNLKVQASIQEEQIRVTGKNKDDLQTVIHMVREKDYPIPLQFKNYR